MKKSGRIFGIDLGTTYSSIAYVDDFGKAVVVSNAENERVTPSVVFFDGDNVVVGSVAKESSKLYPEEVVGFVKRSMGESDYLYSYGDSTYRPEEISGLILKKLVQDAEIHLNEKITEVVVTCPAYFGINEREATNVAGEIAGVNVRQILNEPTAAALAYGVDETEKQKVVLVYDLGGGTFDVTMIHIKPESIQVICTGGDHNLGGKDFDDRIVAYLVEMFQKKTGLTEDILEDPDTWQDLQLAAERSKKILSRRETTPVSVTHGGQRVKIQLSRQTFEDITRDLLERTIGLTREMLRQAQGKGVDKFDEIIMVGGSTRMPMVMERLSQEFATDPKLFDPDEAVAKGAAIFGWKLSVNDDLVERIAAKARVPKASIASGGYKAPAKVVEEAAREVADSRGQALPKIKSAMATITDVSSKSFGIVVDNDRGEEGVFNLIIRNSEVPAQVQKKFFTAIEDQDDVSIRIMESETNDQWLDTFKAIQVGKAILQLPRNLPRDTPVEILFALNKEGRLEITAKETAGGRQVRVGIETTAVMGGRELDQAKSRVRNLVVY